jgi:dolichol-phosphate mannosyltransferase
LHVIVTLFKIDIASNATMPPKLLIMISTYNELHNLPKLVTELKRLLPTADILIVDDNSPDGTGDWCQTASGEVDGLYCLHRPRKAGLGAATREGFQWAIRRNYDLVATMDADFSHNPLSLVELIRRINSEPDVGVVIGSRYVPGGRIVGWPWYRKSMSGFVNRYARLLLGLRTWDNSGALRVYRALALQQIGTPAFDSRGHAYLQEILWRLQRAGVAMLEVPITFSNRRLGNSKTTLFTGLAVACQILKLALKKRKNDQSNSAP